VQLDTYSTGLDSTAHRADRTHEGTDLRLNIGTEILLLLTNTHSCAMDMMKFVSVRFQPVGIVLVRLQEAETVKGREEVNTDRTDFVH
jgi:hypothetical protein